MVLMNGLLHCSDVSMCVHVSVCTHVIVQPSIVIVQPSICLSGIQISLVLKHLA